MADNIRYFSTNKVPTADMGQVIDTMMTVGKDSRKSWERRWYDNNFFDDGFHFRYMSRQQNKIIDLSQNQNIYAPMRAIPKASRQIRGVANLLLSSDPTPVVYPVRINRAAFPPIQQMDPQTGQPMMMENPELKEAMKLAKRIAQMSGHWVEEEFKKQDILEKLALMLILTCKHGVSYMQIWPDAAREELKSQVYDAFDIYLMGNLTSIYDSPFIIKTAPMLISEIKANENFDKDQTAKINPDNKHASSEIKEAYMTSRYGRTTNADYASTLILKEAYIKEYLNNENMSRIRNQKNGEDLLKGKKEGDIVIRQVFAAGNIWLKDLYLNIPEYPFVDFRLEPGSIYSTPFIERFIPANKSLDLLVSRLEKYTHTMATGAWVQPRSEGDLDISNTPGGQVIKYTAVPPIQAQIAPIPSFYFNFMGLLESFIEEQGLSTSVLGKIPNGVKAHSAIESLKESEYANLVISSRRLKGTIKRIAEKMLDYADSYFVTPQAVSYMEKGEPQYFDIIGASALNKRKELKVETPEDVIPLKKDYRVEIEIQSGIGFTREGKRAAMQEVIQELRAYAVEGYVPPQAIKIAIEKYLEVYQFGSTAEFMEAMDAYQDGGNMTNQQIDAMKVGMLEVMQDMQGQGILPTSEQRIEETKVGVVEVAKDMRSQGGGLNASQQVK